MLIGSLIKSARIWTIEVSRWRASRRSARRTKSPRRWGPRTRSEAATATRRWGPTFFCTGFIHSQGPSLERLAVEEPNGLLCLRVIVELDESETAFPAGLTVKRNENVQHITRSGKMRTDVFFRSVVRKVTNKKPDGHVTS